MGGEGGEALLTVLFWLVKDLFLLVNLQPAKSFSANKPRGASPLRQFLFSLGGVGFGRKNGLRLRGLRIYEKK